MKHDSPLHGVKKQVLEVPAYTLRAYEAEIKLNQNENPHDFPADLKEEVLRRYAHRSWSRYPDFVPDTLRKALADFACWEKDGILVGNGSNELLQVTMLVLLREGSRVVLPSPTFTVYSLISRILGAAVINVPLNEDLSFNADELIEKAVEQNAMLLVVCTPNNPTGSLLRDEDLQRILDEFDGFVLLDEAYFEFCGESALKHLESRPRLIITRTFSKAMGMAGLRLGYLMAHPGLVEQIAKAKLPYNVNQFSLTAAEVALEYPDRFRAAIESILDERGRLEAELRSIPGIHVYPSAANFLLFRVPSPPKSVFDELYKRGVLIRDVSAYPMLSSCLRVTVGKQSENHRFLAALRESLKHLSA